MTSITQCGSTIIIRRRPRAELPKDFCGAADEAAREIEIPEGLCADAEREAIAHEFYEIANERLGLELDHRQLSAVAVLAVEMAKQMGEK